ncbi:UDP-N-acetylmuramoyl-tripeptide--D-alanyl-D-alanine ligase [Rubrivirga sp. S365]|uniref:UDP-N-acetylmuramoyl-tripeptide--D-alanyl-D-alanine ligase n=1 Tax=Rubrivirga litoralis TaxID=3075598 RepID=A0ABU3BM07_9BACT|nr:MULTISPECIES: UDP-N-acetylmuramoyl-tripeptide--D-alanyl-D-alanine ligase [unclassified Rubrivirga]MDT0630275.1 UDP-N-acetylmuramoyl-tripeptide--D-alanyl-D-alanine ligase [Rubrivirga sp. F394]MDT7855787.1 UDP-N-acetylmuramoyl-tripeptide--D-alanyl-D-alanine ligase [Rubrivirga sp. S365]
MYSTDTRTLQPGDTYVAIRGERFDGHDFVPQAVAGGAAAVVVERDVDVPEGVEVVRVESALDHLTSLAHQKMAESGAAVVGITGSVGKTTTKNAAIAVLRERFEVVAAEGNLNTPLGLALTVLNRTFAADSVAVLEMGARIPGDIAELCRLFPPTVSVVTAVQGVHLETLGSLEGVAREKGAIVRALGPEGTAVLNADDARVRAMADGLAARVLLYGAAPDADVGPDIVTATLPLLGEHALSTALAAAAVGRALGLDDAAINRGLAQIQPEKGRLVRLPGRGGSTIIDDTYNASPGATRSALGVLRDLDATRHVALLGDMLELGADEVEQHVVVLDAAREHADLVVAVGEIMGRAAELLNSAGPGGAVLTFATSTDLADALRAGRPFAPGAGDAVLVKGSQGARMERVAAALLDPDVDPADVLARQSVSWQQTE